MYTEKKRTTIIMATAIIMNLALFLSAYYFKLPLWLDTTGTIYAAVLLGAPAGFVVAIANNLIQAFGFYGADSLLFYIVSALTAFTAGSVMKDKKRSVLRWVLLAVYLFAICSVSSIILTFITTDGVPADYWGSTLYGLLLANGVAPAFSTMLSVAVVKILDVLISLAVVVLSVAITPKAVKTDAVTIKNKVVGD